MEEITKELNRATEYLRAMKRAKTADKEDCDNVMMHLGNIEDLVNNLAIHNVSKRLWTFDCWDRHGKMQEVLIEAYDAEHATLLFKANEDYEHLGFDPPY